MKFGILLKNIGFNYPTLYYYNEAEKSSEKLHNDFPKINDWNSMNYWVGLFGRKKCSYISAPNYYEILEWLNKEQNFDICINKIKPFENQWFYTICDNDTKDTLSEIADKKFIPYNSFNECMKAAVIKCCVLINENNINNQ